MPYYEYRCSACGQELEVMQRITDEPLDACPSCGGHLNKLISNTGFILKGTGWYATDYARKSASPKSPSSSKDKGDSKDSKTPESTKKKEE
jgi:putative FmdB family regulatory protein